MSRSLSTSLIARCPGKGPAPGDDGRGMSSSPAQPTAATSSGTPDLRVDIHSGVPAVAEIGGDIDIASAPWLRETLLAAIQHHGPALSVDLRAVTFMDCSGVSVLLSTMRRASLEGGWMRVVGSSPQAWRVVRLLGLADVLTGAGHAQTDCPGPRSLDAVSIRIPTCRGEGTR
jgi:anti-anti-sigma factor